ncbi:MAG TPA: nucleotidyltransferase domain-containing protein [Candidatus Nanoarchaeia archaeon]|nr:nucleotidyltransferase domain-containing protein [Candidatus Nanoarchaeia archaeon]
MNVYKITAEKVADEFASMIKMYVNIILLYGSTVRGGMTPESDIDILVIVKDKTNINKIQDSAGELSVKIGKPISVVVMTTAEFNKEKKKQFIQSVRENHKVLYGKSPF